MKVNLEESFCYNFCYNIILLFTYLLVRRTFHQAGFRQQEMTHIRENIIVNELLIREGAVDIGWSVLTETGRLPF